MIDKLFLDLIIIMSVNNFFDRYTASVKPVIAICLSRCLAKENPMIFYFILSLFMIAVLAVIALQHLNTNRIVDIQLEQHKMMFPSQVRGARIVYVRGIYRSHPSKRNWRLVAIVLDVLAAIGLVTAIVMHYQDAFSADLMTSPFGLRLAEMLAASNNEIQNIFLFGGMVLALISSMIWFYLTQWLFQLLEKADQDHDSDATDLYWTPKHLLKRQYQLRISLQGILMVGAIFLALTGAFNWLPVASEMASQTRLPRTVSSSSASTASSSSEVTNESATSSSWTQNTDTTYPIDAMKTAPLAPASELASLTDADRAALFFTAYWTLNGLQQSEVADYANSTSETYSYHLVPGSSSKLIVFSEFIPSVNQTDYMFYALIDGEQVAFYTMYQSKTPITSLASQYSLTVSGTTLRPSMPEIRDSDMNMRQLIGAFKSDKSFDQTKKGLHQGADIPL